MYKTKKSTFRKQIQKKRKKKKKYYELQRTVANCKLHDWPNQLCILDLLWSSMRVLVFRFRQAPARYHVLWRLISIQTFTFSMQRPKMYKSQKSPTLNVEIEWSSELLLKHWTWIFVMNWRKIVTGWWNGNLIYSEGSGNPSDFETQICQIELVCLKKTKKIIFYHMHKWFWILVWQDCRNLKLDMIVYCTMVVYLIRATRIRPQMATLHCSRGAFRNGRVLSIRWTRLESHMICNSNRAKHCIPVSLQHFWRLS